MMITKGTTVEEHAAGLVLARGKSSELPRKNIQILNGLPLLAWVLRPMKDYKGFDSLWVATDDNDIAEVASKWGANIFWRSPRTSQDRATSVEAVQEFLQYHPEVTVVALVQCTSPCIHPNYLKNAHDMIINNHFDSVFSVTRQHKLRWSEVFEDGSTKALNFDPAKRPRRQDWPGELVETGHFYFVRRYLVMSGLLQGGRCGYVELPAELCTEIDSEFDWMMAEHQVKFYGYYGDCETS
ncbi:N-acylneuraminate cytidylyltransferase-like isoform X1 [Limulus polyphemus]|uniref:N-acylneuraminate cytidylyltransferase-like isoform X1 n=1 Tax=Limulus polyphemus TaxID=6850 RepID=A0ABM1C5B0_LIMPO|nr:N-acylneuraminate cytidylyltransferase-like isoform X1 [Limulus polyphemus]